jgi:uncharacterized membrane protein YhaH (DUF805 family)
VSREGKPPLSIAHAECVQSAGAEGRQHSANEVVHPNQIKRHDMTFGESISTCFSKYATFDGRASRSEYWWWFLFSVLAAMAAAMVSETLYGLFCLATLLPSLAVGARRLHDTDRSGWFLLLWLIPVVGWLVVVFFAVQEGKEPNRFASAS